MKNLLKEHAVDYLPKLAILGWLRVVGCAFQKHDGGMARSHRLGSRRTRVGRNGMLVVYSICNFQTKVGGFYGNSLMI